VRVDKTWSIGDVDCTWMQGHKKMVLDGVISYFVQQDEKHTANSAVEDRFVAAVHSEM